MDICVTICIVSNTSSAKKNAAVAGHWWLTPVILAAQETKIRRIMVQSQPRQIVRDPTSEKKKITKKGWWSVSRYRL
jgi:hypothetical protein